MSSLDIFRISINAKKRRQIVTPGERENAAVETNNLARGDGDHDTEASAGSLQTNRVCNDNENTLASNQTHESNRSASAVKLATIFTSDTSADALATNAATDSHGDVPGGVSTIEDVEQTPSPDKQEEEEEEEGGGGGGEKEEEEGARNKTNQFSPKKKSQKSVEDDIEMPCVDKISATSDEQRARDDVRENKIQTLTNSKSLSPTHDCAQEGSEENGHEISNATESIAMAKDDTLAERESDGEVTRNVSKADVQKDVQKATKKKAPKIDSDQSRKTMKSPVRKTMASPKARLSGKKRAREEQQAEDVETGKRGAKTQSPAKTKKNTTKNTVGGKNKVSRDESASAKQNKVSDASDRSSTTGKDKGAAANKRKIGASDTTTDDSGGGAPKKRKVTANNSERKRVQMARERHKEFMKKATTDNAFPRQPFVREIREINKKLGEPTWKIRPATVDKLMRVVTNEMIDCLKLASTLLSYRGAKMLTANDVRLAEYMRETRYRQLNDAEHAQLNDILAKKKAIRID